MTRLMARLCLLLCALLLALALLGRLGGTLRPNGRLLSYTRTSGSALYLMDVDHGRVFTFDDFAAQHVDPHHLWSPDGTRLALTTNGGISLHVLDVRSGQRADIGAPGCCYASVNWSPDSRELAFIHQTPGSITAVLRTEIGSNVLRPVLTQRLTGTTSLVWSPDGAALLLAVEGRRDHRLLLIDAATHQARVLAQQILSVPVWSPDGAALAVVSDRFGNPDIYLLNPQSGELTEFIRSPGDDFAPVWSPDGRRLSYISTDEGYASIYLLDLDSGLRWRLAQFAYYDQRQSVWSPDGRWLTFGSIINGTGEIFIGDVHSREVRRLTFDGDNIYPGWQP